MKETSKGQAWMANIKSILVSKESSGVMTNIDSPKILTPVVKTNQRKLTSPSLLTRKSPKK